MMLQDPIHKFKLLLLCITEMALIYYIEGYTSFYHHTWPVNSKTTNVTDGRPNRESCRLLIKKSQLIMTTPTYNIKLNILEHSKPL